jgi:riboflavin kinase/FMN adenylyltransferase
MKVIFNYKKDYRTKEPSAIALGTFDGIHLGHRRLIKELMEKKAEYGYQTIVYTFINHPLQLLMPGKEPSNILLLRERIQEFKKLGIDVLVLNSFDYSFSQQSPDEFITQLTQSIPVKTLIAGFNFRFGHKAAGDVDYLKKISEKANFDLICVPPVKKNNQIVSSSLIRKRVMDGSVAKAAHLLTRPYYIRGKVIHGFGRGKELGFPTANLSFSSKKVLPKNGVYLTRCKLQNKFYWGLTNVGMNPTFLNDIIQIETFLLDFCKDIYGENLEIQFIDWIREEKHFETPQDLSYQIKKDWIKAKKLIYKDYSLC